MICAFLLSVAGALLCAFVPERQVERLLDLAVDYRQVERAVLLLAPNSLAITRVPCISPLRAEDMLRIPVSSAYGRRLHPLLREYKHHSGIDLPAEQGEDVYASAGGRVLVVGCDPLLGNYIKLEHAHGFVTIYGHLHSCAVSVGDTVRIGRIIGHVGNTGRSTGPHLHYGITKYGKEQNPLPYCYLYLRWQAMLSHQAKRRAPAGGRFAGSPA